MAFVEMTAKTVDEAVAKALKELNITAEEAVVEVLEEGKKGFLGMFSKDAKVRVTAKEVAARGIRVNAIAPGFIKTDMTSVLPEKVVEAMLAGIPLNRLGETEDIAKAVLFLASSDANYITGQTLHVDGGMVM